MRYRLLLPVLALLALFAPTQAQQAASKLPIYGFETIKVYPHDPKAFTQGLLYSDGVLYESTGSNSGINGSVSSVRRVELETGKVLDIQTIPGVFAEGLALVGNNLIQVTWFDKKGFVYDKITLKKTKEFAYKGEGWGLTYDGQRLIMSDGSEFLRFFNPLTLKETGKIAVKTPDGKPVRGINELEYIGGEVFANVWQTDYIIRINPRTGMVVGVIDLAGIIPRLPGMDVLNGIAYDKESKRIWVTGKYWPFLFEIKVIKK
jgi:glutaminyl-peptide cyclotransferase